MNAASQTMLRLCALVACIASLQPACSASGISSFAFVHEDGSLTINGLRIHLYGIYIPPTERTCTTTIQPMPCGTRASLALEFKVSGDFVRCTERTQQADGSITANCSAGNADLSEWMLQRGWAVALPDAPFHYAALEKIARAKGIGIWGIPVDAVRPAQ
jgi:endonuclease YncB( thermonuclease family)